ncbi:DUF2530 domain-containing protein [Pseudonocardia bannensis]|uniref:DUF2530 domain-containing protein n=1 Tax=Pseudonocardia bannensis TaxID=630973 RepID=A0A848DKU6_9PSEU|nr:DUF2530 domain-containing protein [Pseudonocardia bannensis]NMH93312.1 DUF2530 domain-containing protein [Pseudonocardia bannensis]
MIDPPPLPRRFGEMSMVVAVGTLGWLAGASVLLLAYLIAGRPLDIWFTTCVAGAVLGGIGYGIFRWQRAAARRGARGAQQGLD